MCAHNMGTRPEGDGGGICPFLSLGIVLSMSHWVAPQPRQLGLRLSQGIRHIHATDVYKMQGCWRQARPGSLSLRSKLPAFPKPPQFPSAPA